MKTLMIAMLVAFATAASAQQTFTCHPGLGHTKGFWHNVNGKAVLAGHDTAWRDELNLLNLVNPDGTPYAVPAGNFDAAHEDFAGWILSPPRGNMAHILATQLAATVLNVEFGDMNTLTNLHVDWRGNKEPLANLIADAADLLLQHPLTKSPSAERDLQEEYKDLFDAINNNMIDVCEPQGAPPPPPPAAVATLSATTPPGGEGAGVAGCAAGAGGLPVLFALGLLAWRRRR